MRYISYIVLALTSSFEPILVAPCLHLYILPPTPVLLPVTVLLLLETSSIVSARTEPLSLSGGRLRTNYGDILHLNWTDILQMKQFDGANRTQDILAIRGVNPVGTMSIQFSPLSTKVTKLYCSHNFVLHVPFHM